ncbi:MAG: hypothetical protein P1V97_10045, partial [Planctomycetota bacterium]|nr:hypothetical protein [Planctomycetota bacterium]
KVELDPRSHNDAFSELKSLIEQDLRHPAHSSPYMFPAKSRQNQNLCAFLARNASKIADIVAQALSPDEAREQVKQVLKKYAGPGRQRSSTILKIRVLREALVVGERVPIEVYLTDGLGMRNMTNRVQITVEPSFRAEINDNILKANAPGPIRVVAQSDSERSELDLFIKPSINASIETLDSRRSKTGDDVNYAETKPLERPPEDDDEAVPSLDAMANNVTLITGALPSSPDDAPTLITPNLHSSPSAYDRPIAPSQRDADETPTQMLGKQAESAPQPNAMPPLPPLPPALQTPVGEVIATTMDPGLIATAFEPNSTTYEPAAGRGTARFFGKEEQSELLNTHRAGFNHMVLALVIMSPEPASRPYEVLIDGQACLRFGSGFFQHFLLRPGGRSINIELESQGKCIVRDRLDLTWTCPESPQGQDADSPAVCIEMFWRFKENQSQARSRVRVLATSRFVSLSDGQSGQALRMVRKPGDVYSGSLDLGSEARKISFLSRTGEHSIDLQTKRNKAQWS